MKSFKFGSITYTVSGSKVDLQSAGSEDIHLEILVYL